jgi:fatty-acyl-CoA synthase
MIITGGLNVYPAEVESVMGEFPGVTAAAVLGIPDEEWGEKLVAFITLDDEAVDTFDEAELQAFIKARKGSVQTPKSIFVIDAFPLTKIGKPDKVALQDLAVERDAALAGA